VSEVQADAPGRVNLIGEHTDYQDGFVLPSAVPQRTQVTLTARAGRRVRASSEQKPAEPIEYDLGEESRGRGWADYVQGLTWVTAQLGLALSGFDLRIRSDVPVGSGLASSAALEVSVLRAMRTAFEWPLNDVDLARAAQRAEVEFVGAPVGIMDQMASSLANGREALFIDTRSLYFERIPLPQALELVVVDSGVAHRHAAGEYATRRREAEEAARLLGVGHLRELDETALPRVSALPAVLAQRARHIIQENGRVLQARDALSAGDLTTLGALFNASHASLRDDYQVTIAPVDLLVALLASSPEVFGARMTGGGFGGAVVAAARAGAGGEVAARIRPEYERRTGYTASILLPFGAASVGSPGEAS
jgi:galactokinase